VRKRRFLFVQEWRHEKVQGAERLFVRKRRRLEEDLEWCGNSHREDNVCPVCEGVIQSLQDDLFCIKLYQQTVRPCGIVYVRDPGRKNATLFLSLHTF
jgi:hypothetical protein